VPPYTIPIKNSEYIFYTPVISQADTNIFQVNPTIAPGDFRVSTDGGAFDNLATTPVVDPAGGVAIKVTVSAAEMNGDNVVVVGTDAAGGEWQSVFAGIQPETVGLSGIAAAAAIAVWAYGTRTLTSATNIACDFWSCSTRTLTMALSSIRGKLSASEIDIDAGDYIEMNITQLGDISGRTKLWFTVKKSKEDADSAAWIMIEETAGLEYINGVEATTPANGSITVTDAVRGDITIELDGVESVKLTDADGKGYFDIKWINAAGKQLTLRRGKATVIADVTRAVA
jgi:hypothetical protein